MSRWMRWRRWGGRSSSSASRTSRWRKRKPASAGSRIRRAIGVVELREGLLVGESRERDELVDVEGGAGHRDALQDLAGRGRDAGDGEDVEVGRPRRPAGPLGQLDGHVRVAAERAWRCARACSAGASGDVAGDQLVDGLAVEGRQLELDPPVAAEQAGAELVERGRRGAGRCGGPAGARRSPRRGRAAGSGAGAASPRRHPGRRRWPAPRPWSPRPAAAARPRRRTGVDGCSGRTTAPRPRPGPCRSPAGRGRPARRAAPVGDGRGRRRRRAAARTPTLPRSTRPTPTPTRQPRAGGLVGHAAQERRLADPGLARER